LKKLGVIADTHGYVDPKAVEIFRDVDMILHAGDVGSAEVITELEKIAPVVAVSGNHEDEATASYDWLKTIEVEGAKIALTHRFFPLNMENVVKMPPGWQRIMGVDGVRVMVFGHSHEPLCSQGEDTLYYNPGYSGPDMIEPIRTAGVICIDNGDVRAQTYFLSPPPRPEYLDRASFFEDSAPEG